MMPVRGDLVRAANRPLQGAPVPEVWVTPWQQGVGVSLAGMASLQLEDLVARTVAVAETFAKT